MQEALVTQVVWMIHTGWSYILNAKVEMLFDDGSWILGHMQACRLFIITVVSSDLTTPPSPFPVTPSICTPRPYLSELPPCSRVNISAHMKCETCWIRTRDLTNAKECRVSSNICSMTRVRSGKSYDGEDVHLYYVYLHTL